MAVSGAARHVAICGGQIPLGALLKWAGVVETGGEAKRIVQEGRVRVNGTVETRRKRAVLPGDVVDVGGVRLLVVAEA